ncbi:hypothetical protein CRG98_016543 [Punica granatum]|uniref:Uncharacterized protein n=1 Tax=Punica granatum TaxID=22663 RepID=A0A2I0K3H9_PUNGR|nr:hypothetical protein CRG98_016543 [Punica granatum]
MLDGDTPVSTVNVVCGGCLVRSPFPTISCRSRGGYPLRICALEAGCVLLRGLSLHVVGGAPLQCWLVDIAEGGLGPSFGKRCDHANDFRGGVHRGYAHCGGALARRRKMRLVVLVDALGCAKGRMPGCVRGASRRELLLRLWFVGKCFIYPSSLSVIDLSVGEVNPGGCVREGCPGRRVVRILLWVSEVLVGWWTLSKREQEVE